MAHSKSGITAEEVVEIEKDLFRKGYRQIGDSEELEKRHFKVTSHTDDADSSGDDEKFNITWCE